MGLPLESSHCTFCKVFHSRLHRFHQPNKLRKQKMIVKPNLQSDGTLVLTVVAMTLTSADAAEFRETARLAIESSTGMVSVECSQLEFIDSSGVGALLHLNNLLPAARRPVRLTGVSTKLMASLELMRVHRQFDLQPCK